MHQAELFSKFRYEKTLYNGCVPYCIVLLIDSHAIFFKMIGVFLFPANMFSHTR